MSDPGELPRRRAPETRALWWLLGGLGLLALTVVALMPELLGDLSGLGALALVVLAAGLPGIAIMGVVAVRRRPTRTHDGDDGGHDSRARPHTGG